MAPDISWVVEGQRLRLGEDEYTKVSNKPARKVFTEAMIRKVLKNHFEIEAELARQPLSVNTYCECGWSGSESAFEDHFIDQLHKLWHEMFSRPVSPTSTLGMKP